MFSAQDFRDASEKARVIRDAQLKAIDDVWRLLNGTEPPNREIKPTTETKSDRTTA